MVLITLIWSSCKKRHSELWEFAKKREVAPDSGSLEAVRLRLRPIIMTSMAFILGSLGDFSVELVAVARQNDLVLP